MQELRKRITNGGLEKVCLLYGEESYLIRRYENDIIDLVVPEGAGSMNFTVLMEKEATSASIEEACETMPFLAEKRLILVKNSKLFVAGRKDESEKLAAYIANVPEHAHLVFIESEIDKRGKLYKRLAEAGRAAEFKTQREEDLIPWVVNVFSKNGVQISRGLAAEFIRTVGSGMDTLNSEIEKLAAYKRWEGEIAREDIDRLCVKSLEASIFELVGAVGNRNAGRALDIFSNLMLLKEPPVMVISMIARQLRLTLQCKALLEKRLTYAQIASKLGLWDRAVKEYAKQFGGVAASALIQGLYDCLDADLNIKTGKTEAKLAAEMLIVKLSSLGTGG